MTVTKYVKRKAFSKTNTAAPSDADFHAFRHMLLDALTGVGLVQTSDTGQITDSYTGFSSVAQYGLAGYTILRANDTMQATAPIFVRIQWHRGSTTAAANAFGIVLQIGTSTDGAGNLYDVAATSAHTVSNSGAGQWYDVIGCGDDVDGSWGAFTVDSIGATYSPILVVERTRSQTTLTADTRGAVVIGCGYTTALGTTTNAALSVRALKAATGAVTVDTTTSTVSLPLNPGSHIDAAGRYPVWPTLTAVDALSPVVAVVQYPGGSTWTGAFVDIDLGDGKTRTYYFPGKQWSNYVGVRVG